MASISRLKPEQIVYDVTHHRMGNTTMSTAVVLEVRIIAVDPLGQWVDASWNHTTPRLYSANHPSLRRWRVSKPELRTGFMGRQIVVPHKRNALGGEV